MDLTLSRKLATSSYTMGQLFADGWWLAYTLEDPIRPDGVKIAGATAIPAGRYEVRLSVSKRFQKIMPEVLNVPDFEGIRIHGGMTAADTLGCILVGRSRSTIGIAHCQPAKDDLMELLTAAESKRENSWITISNPDGWVLGSGFTPHSTSDPLRV